MGTPVNSLTLAVSDGTHRVPGISTEMARDLACMHDPTVRRWIAEQQAAAPPDGAVVVADPGWANPGDGTESVTFSVDGRDAAAFNVIWDRIMSSCERAGTGD